MIAIMSVGNALSTVSTYGRTHNAAMNLGFNDDTDTYLLISSKFKTLKLKFLSKFTHICRHVVKLILPWELCWSNYSRIYGGTLWISSNNGWLFDIVYTTYCNEHF